MADVKRSFYTKDFGKKDFFTAVAAICNGEDVSDEVVDLVAKAAEYELEGIANRPSKAGTGEKKDALQSDYAVALRAAIVPLITGEPKTAKELIDAATAKGKVAPSGKAFAAPWVARVLNSEAGVVAVKKVIEAVDAKGLKSQKEVTAYKRG